MCERSQTGNGKQVAGFLNSVDVIREHVLIDLIDCIEILFALDDRSGRPAIYRMREGSQIINPRPE